MNLYDFDIIFFHKVTNKKLTRFFELSLVKTNHIESYSSATWVRKDKSQLIPITNTSNSEKQLG